jgi:hypothetical protein
MYTEMFNVYKLLHSFVFSIDLKQASFSSVIRTSFQRGVVEINNLCSFLNVLKVRQHRKHAAAAGRPSREIAAVCDLVTPDRARQLRAVQCEEKPSSWGYKVVSICFCLGYFPSIHDVQFR